ncbi:AGE family epimerase/isomerase [Paracoccus sp. 1_MG-2023]|uniref:AGE family epimerase/isomerase n=1 Tax=unclassified Paracoccus (in: a-proteobacteria) TaxID=2688777 RepID=UPI001C08C2E4|nr:MULTISPECIES: AGE family epimerase/isomerase [unclassified Paracoccus (in: a-proteobacteria)]MBU2957620.1 AGE family epimerase/isomerase [Paracoccus sp. C2R09]MDO6667533.1 AGE family epimerase/isomerase [Paracoccus sp. 1_MG-2023]
MIEGQDIVAACEGFASRRIPAWLKAALPPGTGPAPVIEALGDDGPRTTLAQCRTVFALAHLARVAHIPELLMAAERIQGFVVQHLRDGDWGHRFAVAPDGTALDDPASRLRRSYDQSFALLSVAALIRAGSDSADADDLDRIWGFIETLIDPETGALWEDDRGPDSAQLRAQNPQMHMLEALLEAYSATNDRIWLERAAHFVGIGSRHFIDPETGAVREFVGRDLEPLQDATGQRREPGHQYEWAWLLHCHADLSGDDAPRALAHRMKSFAEAHGLRRGGELDLAPFDAVDAAGQVTEATHLLWPLTEAGKLYALLGDREAALRMGQLIFGAYFAPGQEPRWINQLDGEGRTTWDAALTRLLYHVAIFVTEGHRAGFWRMEGPRG